MRQNGNILFLILLAVVLFAALSYAVTSSMRGGGKDMSAEAAQSSAAQILNTVNLIGATVQRLQLVNNCRDTEINFANNFVRPASYVNNNSPEDKRCNVFDPAGGGAVISKITESALEPCNTSSSNPQMCGGGVLVSERGYARFTGNYAIRNIGTSISSSGIMDSTSVELAMLVPKLKKEVCLAINDALGIANPSGNPPSVAGTLFTNVSIFTGTYLSTQNGGPIGQPTACVRDAYDNGVYFLYHVLIPR